MMRPQKECSIYWCLFVSTMWKAWNHYTERPRALTLLNAPLIVNPEDRLSNDEAKLKLKQSYKQLLHSLKYQQNYK